MISRITKFQQFFFCLCLLCLINTSLLGQSIPDTVIINTEIIPGPTDEDVTVNLVVKRFSQIISFQFEMLWDPSIFNFQSVGNYGLDALNEKSFGTTEAMDKGTLKFVWITSNFVEGSTLKEGDVIFSINFKRQSFVPHNIAFLGGRISQNDLVIEITSTNGSDVLFQSENTTITNNHEIEGIIFFDENNDCLYQETEKGIPNLLIQFSDQFQNYSAITDSTGTYRVQVFPGDYTLKNVYPFNDYWEVCNIQDTSKINYNLSNTSNSRNIPVSISVDCPALSVNVSINRLRRCFEETYRIDYINQGTQIAPNAYVIVKFDPFLNILESSMEGISLGDNEYRYELGDIDLLEAGVIKVVVATDCETTALGQTHCVEAFIFPNIDCREASDLWSRANLDLAGVCTTDSVQFVVQNSGAGDMTTSIPYQLFENLAFVDSGFIQLNQGQTQNFSYPANGSTYRFQTNQVAHHPTPTPLFAVMEGCGTDESGEFDNGFVTPFSLEEQDPFYAIHCIENRGSFDPNDKRGLPLGYGPNNYIEQDQALVYKIRFQNTGTDTAYKVVVVDTLSSHLNVTSLTEFSSSHDYQLSITRGNILTFTFDDILLVDSFTNEPASNGYIEFKIDQQKNVPLETNITNLAAIYFDFNKPIFTNITQHRVGKDFYRSFLSTNTIQLPPTIAPTIVSVQPNPFTTSTSIKIQQDQIIPGQLYLYNQIGQQLRQYDFLHNEVSISNKSLLPGVYFYKIQVNGQGSMGGKLMLLGE